MLPASHVALATNDLTVQSLRFADLVQQALREGRRDLCIFAVDLPGVLEIAETYGETVRQTLLQRGFTHLVHLFGAEAVVCDPDLRFMLLVKGITASDAPSVAKRIQDALKFRKDDTDIVMVGRPSVGAAIHTVGTLGEPDDLIRRARLALQQALRDCPGSFCLYNTALDVELRQSTILRQALHKACDANAFRIEYQPIINLRTSVTVGLEALIRWDAPHGAITDGPAHFIAIAEDTGLIVPIGAQILTGAMRQTRAWQCQGLNPPRVSVNVSAHQLTSPGFFDMLTKALTENALTPDALELELTERTLIGGTPEMIRLLEHLRSIGVTISVDDFGTGYSSLRYLQDLPISKFKIDRIFVDRLDQGARERALVNTLIHLATSYDLTVVAEGIETRSQLAILRRLGCSAGQGFLFSPAVPPGDVTATFDRRWSQR